MTKCLSGSNYRGNTQAADRFVLDALLLTPEARLGEGGGGETSKLLKRQMDIGTKPFWHCFELPNFAGLYIQGVRENDASRNIFRVAEVVNPSYK